MLPRHEPSIAPRDRKAMVVVINLDALNSLDAQFLSFAADGLHQEEKQDHGPTISIALSVYVIRFTMGTVESKTKNQSLEVDRGLPCQNGARQIDGAGLDRNVIRIRC